MTTTHTQTRTPDHFLVLIDDSSSSEKVLRYLSDLVTRLDDGGLTVTLLHGLDLPPRLVEHGGSEKPSEETKRERDLAVERKAWIEESAAELEPLFDHARALLKPAGLRDNRIEQRVFAEVGDELPRETLRIATETGCGTIVLGRSSLPWYRELTHRHLADELIDRGEGFAVVVLP